MATTTSSTTPSTSPALPAVPTVPTTSTTSDLNTYLQQAQSILGPTYQGEVSAAQEAGNVEEQGFNLEAQQELGTMPLVQQTYANLAQELGINENIDIGAIKQQGDQNIGGARAANAAAGITGSSGAFNAPITAAENQETGAIASTTESYSAQQTSAALNYEGQIQDITNKAADYEQQGNAAAANTLTTLAGLASDYNNQLLTYASSAQSSENTYNMDLAKYNLSVVSAQSSATSTAVDQLFWQTGNDKGQANSNVDFTTVQQQLTAQLTSINGATPSKRMVDLALGEPADLVAAGVPAGTWWNNKGNTSFSYNGKNYSAGNEYQKIGSSATDQVY